MSNAKKFSVYTVDCFDLTPTEATFEKVQEKAIDVQRHESINDAFKQFIRLFNEDLVSPSIHYLFVCNEEEKIILFQ